MPKVAAFDLGTNTFLCLIAEVSGDKGTRDIKVLEDHARVVRLGEKVHHSGKFSDEALKRADLCLGDFSKAIQKHNVEYIVATATSAARDVSNGQLLLDIGAKYSIPIKIIAGEREAQLSFAGAVSALPNSQEQRILVIDVGGGSTELIFRAAHEEKIKAQSFNVGAVRLTEMFIKADPISNVEYEALQTYANKVLKAYGRVTPDLVIAVAGTPTTLACVALEEPFKEEKVEGYVLTKEKLRDLIRNLSEMKIEDRKKLKGMVPERADVIIAGASLLESCLDLTSKSEISVSTRGLRFGTALNYDEFI